MYIVMWVDMCINMCVDMCGVMCAQTCVQITCIGMCAGLCVDMCVSGHEFRPFIWEHAQTMCTGTCVGLCVSMCTDTSFIICLGIHIRVGLCRDHVSGHMSEHGYRPCVWAKFSHILGIHEVGTLSSTGSSRRPSA